MSGLLISGWHFLVGRVSTPMFCAQLPGQIDLKTSSSKVARISLMGIYTTQIAATAGVPLIRTSLGLKLFCVKIRTFKSAQDAKTSRLPLVQAF